jgi:hypothetical protein
MTSREDQLIIQAFARLDRMALGVALGAVCGLGVFLATVLLLLKGGTEPGPTLALLGQYFVGYTVTPVGSLVGLAYGAAAGFLVGWLVAALHNLAISVYLFSVRFSAQAAHLGDFIDPDRP